MEEQSIPTNAEFLAQAAKFFLYFGLFSGLVTLVPVIADFLRLALIENWGRAIFVVVRWVYFVSLFVRFHLDLKQQSGASKPGLVRSGVTYFVDMGILIVLSVMAFAKGIEDIADWLGLALSFYGLLFMFFRGVLHFLSLPMMEDADFSIETTEKDGTVTKTRVKIDG